MKGILAVLLIFLLMVPSVQAAFETGEGVGETSTTAGSVGSGASGAAPGGGAKAPSGGGGGGGGTRLTLDSFVIYLDTWQKDNPALYQQMVKHLTQGVQVSPKDPYVALYHKGNRSVNREDMLKIFGYVQNSNTLDQRTTYFLSLEAKEPTQDFKKITQVPLVIQPFSYQEKDKLTCYFATWPEISTFGNLIKSGVFRQKTGEMSFRASVTDGSKTWTSDLWPDNAESQDYYGVLKLNLTNRPPTINNSSINLSIMNPRFNDPFEYKANITDPDGDMLNITLHILDEQEHEYKNRTQMIKGGGPVSFNSREYDLFSEGDAGKNFSYYYSFDDELAFNKTEPKKGPYIRRAPLLFVDKLDCIPESRNYYWWQWYTFYARVKNMNPEEANVDFTLFAKTGDNEWRSVGDRKTVKIGPEPSMVYFNTTKPFVVNDENMTFSYMIKYSEYDQRGKDTIEAIGSRINPKIVPYSIKDPIILLNLALIFFLVVAGSLLIERKLKRGIEAQESSKKVQNKVKPSNDTMSSILRIIRKGD